MRTHRQTVTEVFSAKTKNLTVDFEGLNKVQVFCRSAGKGTASIGGKTIEVASKGDRFSVIVQGENLGEVVAKTTGRVDIVAVRWSAAAIRPDDRYRPVRFVTSYRDTDRGVARVQGAEVRGLSGLPYREPVEGHPEDAHYRLVEEFPWQPSIAPSWGKASQAAWSKLWFQKVAG